MQDDAADELNVEMPLPYRAPCGFANDRERLGKKLIERFAALVAALEFLGLTAKLLVRKLFDAPFELVDLLNKRPYLLDLLLARVSEKFIDKSHFCLCRAISRLLLSLIEQLLFNYILQNPVRISTAVSPHSLL